MPVTYTGGRRSPHDNPGPFRSKVVADEKDLLDSLNRYRCHLGWSSRRLDEASGGGLDLGTILGRGARTKTASIFAFMEAMGLELVLQPKAKAKSTRLQQAIAAKKKPPQSDDPAVQAEV